MSELLTDEQIKNWRRLLFHTFGLWAYIMPVEEVQRLRDEVQEEADNIKEEET